MISIGDKHSNLGLEFTGNWFIDAGILGFVNLMEEVYGEVWKYNGKDNFLSILSQHIYKKSEDDVKKLFVYAFWYKVIKDTALRWVRKNNFKKKSLKDNYALIPEELTKNIENNVLMKINNWNEKHGRNIFNKNTEEVYQLVIEFNNFIKNLLGETYKPYKDSLRKIYASNSKTLIENLKNIGIIAYNNFFTNLSFFNPASNKSGKEDNILAFFDKFLDSYYVRKDKKIKSLPNDLFDKTLSPLIYTASDFVNQLYGRPLTLSQIEEIFGINPTYYILSFPWAFVWVRGIYYLFYSPDLEFTYKVNRRLRYLVISLREKSFKGSIFEITWSAILDNVSEYKAALSMENMYIIEYSDIANQQIQNVEYIGISKLQAAFIIDDAIRSALNRSIPTPKKDKNKKTIWIWILKEFIKNKSLLPYILSYVGGLVANKWSEKERNVGKHTLIASIGIDAVIKEMKHSKLYGRSLFDDMYFSNYKDVVIETKQKISSMYYSLKLSLDYVEMHDREKIAKFLFSKVKGGDKYGFVNVLLKYVTGRAQQREDIKEFVNYLFCYILNNDVTWENYALPVVIGLLYGGETNG